MRTEILSLREVREDDLPLFFESQRDPVANQMAAFTSKDPNDWYAFEARWHKILRDPTVIARTIVFGGGS